MPLQSGRMEKVSVTFDRPNDSTAYAAGDAISSNAGGAIVLAGSFRGSGMASYIAGALLLDNANQPDKLQAELWLFSAPLSTTTVSDNEQVAVTGEDLPNLVGIVQLINPFVTNPGAGGSGNVAIAPATDNFPLPLVAGAGNVSTDVNLYGILVARNAYAPVNLERFQIVLYLDQN